MKYEARMTSVDGVGTPSVIPIKSQVRAEAIKEFRQLLRAHGDQSVLKLTLFEIDPAGKESEVSIT